MLLVEGTTQTESSPNQYVTIDGKCPPARNLGGTTASSIGTGSPAVLPVSPGSHTLGVVTTPAGQGLENCDGKTPTGTTSVDVASGQQVDVFVYGPSSAPKILAAPISG